MQFGSPESLHLAILWRRWNKVPSAGIHPAPRLNDLAPLPSLTGNAR